MGNTRSSIKESTSISSQRPTISRSWVQSAFQRPTIQRSSIFPSVQQLTKVLVNQAITEKKLNEIPSDIFARYVFPAIQDLGKRLFLQFAKEVGSSNETLTVAEFCKAVEKIFENQVEVELFLKMYGKDNEITRRDFRSLVNAAYTVAMDHYAGGPRSCPYSSRTIKAIVDGAYMKKDKLSQTDLSYWILTNCPRLTNGLHEYIIYCLCTAHRQKDGPVQKFHTKTPVLKHGSGYNDVVGASIPLSQVWLLSLSLPDIYVLHPRTRQSQLTKLDEDKPVTLCPNHWIPLYRSENHGLGSQSFRDNVMHYPDPTVMVIKCEKGFVFCIASSSEWKEETYYWGTANCAVFQILPEFHCKLIGQEKTLYYNESIRGNPVGIKAGSNPKIPIIWVNSNFSFVNFEGTQRTVLETTVWGCGLEEARKSQMVSKSRKQKDIERAQSVRVNPEEWMNNPDRYLLEMSGNNSYSTDVHSHSIAEEKSISKKSEKKKQSFKK